MKKNTITFKIASLCLLGPIFSFSQDQEKYNFFLDTLCSKEMYGRGYTKNGHNKAASFIENQFKLIGLEPIDGQFIQKFPISVNIFPDSIFFSGKRNFEVGKDFILNPDCGKASLSRNLFFVESSYKELKKKKKRPIVPVIKQNVELTKKLKDQLKNFPVVIYEKERFYGSLSRYQNRQAKILVKPTTLDGSEKVSIKINATRADFHSQNVCGLIKGKESPDSILIVCGHYDHLGGMGQAFFPGANDNASGIALMLTLAGHFKLNPPAHSILFIAFGGEEAGLIGSKYFAQNPIVPLSSIKFVVNLDLWGSGSKGITVVNATKYQKTFNTLVEINKENNYVTTINKRGPSPNSDHHPLDVKGVPSFFIYAMGKDGGYHSVYDTPNKTEKKSYPNNFLLLRDFISSF